MCVCGLILYGKTIAKDVGKKHAETYFINSMYVCMYVHIHKKSLIVFILHRGLCLPQKPRLPNKNLSVECSILPTQVFGQGYPHIPQTIQIIVVAVGYHQLDGKTLLKEVTGHGEVNLVLLGF